jgi:hypothetical protein
VRVDRRVNNFEMKSRNTLLNTSPSVVSIEQFMITAAVLC